MTDKARMPYKDMTESEYYQLYDDLDKYDVNVKCENNETHGGQPVKVTCFTFGSWSITHTLFYGGQKTTESISIFNPELWMCSFAAHNFDSEQPKYKRYKYHIYIAAKNKSLGLPWIKMSRYAFGPKITNKKYVICYPKDKVRGI